MIIAAALAVPAGMLLWGLSPISPDDALSGGKTMYFMMIGSIILMGLTVFANAILLLAMERLLRISTSSPAIPIVATALQGLMIGFSFEWISVAKLFGTNYTLLIFLGIALAVNILFFVAMLWIFSRSN